MRTRIAARFPGALVVIIATIYNKRGVRHRLYQGI